MNVELITQPFATPRLGDYVRNGLAEAKWTEFLAAVAFAKRSGTAHVVAGLHAFARRGRVRVSVGIDHGGTSLEGMEDLWGALDGRGELYAVHHTRAAGDRVHHTFHPKVFLFRNTAEALLLIGSGNLTQGGLYGNYEAGAAFTLVLSDPKDRALHDSVVLALDEWSDPASPLCVPVDASELARLYGAGLLPREASMRPRTPSAPPSSPRGGRTAAPPFNPAPIPPPPPPPPTAPILARPVSSGLPAPSRTVRTRAAQRERGRVPTRRRGALHPSHGVLYIEVIPHDNGEVFLSKLALTDDPAFFGHPFGGTTTPKRAGNPAYPMRAPDPVVDISVFDDTDTVLRTASPHSLNMVEYVRKGEIRITLPDRMQDLIPEMALLVMTLRDPSSGLDYTLDFYPPGSPSYGTYSSNLSTPMPSGGRPGPGRRYGWG